jgi:predicted amidophosphoribosyltransferase
VLRAAEKVSCGLISLLFPDDCRVCGEPLREVSRIPVCSLCLREPEPMAAEFYCVSCKTPFLNRHPLDEEGRCPLCRLGLAGFDHVYSFGSYEGTLRALIHLFKYEKIHTLAKPLGAMLARAVPREERFDVVVPMPLHWRRRWERGFNQSELLAKEIARRWNVPVVGAVRRVKPTAPQAGLTNAKRRANMSGAFVPSRPLLPQILGGFSFVAPDSLQREASDRQTASPSRDQRERFTVQAFRSARKPGKFSSGTKFLTGARVLLIDDVLTTGATAAACARALKRAGARHVTLAAVARTDRRTALTDFLDIPHAATAARAGGQTS